MIIHSMTATFGKLEHETLTLRPGMNTVQAGNEWGKSTWCAFLAAMLYGLETRVKSTKTALADKERFAPWTGSPMAGRIDLNWNGRDITIERTSRGRVPMGVFRAYETASGLPVPELTGENCGERLLGVERSVFLRTAFIRFRDIPVTDDEALRRRLNSLVTTGDESGAADRLGAELKNLKNRIRYHKSGLLPQAEGKREELEDCCREMDELSRQIEVTRQMLEEEKQNHKILENHSQALRYAAFRENEQKLEKARLRRDEALKVAREGSSSCEDLPRRETAAELLCEINRLAAYQTQLQQQLQTLPVVAEPGELSPSFAGLKDVEACARANEDVLRYKELKKKHHWFFWIGLVLAAAGMYLIRTWPQPGLICGALGGVLAFLFGARFLICRWKAIRLEKRYQTKDVDRWLRQAEQYGEDLYLHSPEAEVLRAKRRSVESQLRTLEKEITGATQGQGLDQCRRDWEQVIALWEECEQAQGDYAKAQEHLEALESLVDPVEPPEFSDKLVWTAEETKLRLDRCRQREHTLANRLGQCEGRLKALGDRDAVETELQKLNVRIRELEHSYRAVSIAQETLQEAAQQLQSRFAPRICARARDIMDRMSDGRYDRLTLDQDFRLRAGTREEDTLREVLWRSDGTMDQLYLALRLAVSQELMPEAPLILDDALIRFDDQRLKMALEILREAAEQKQVILFTCHSRETDMLETMEE